MEPEDDEKGKTPQPVETPSGDAKRAVDDANQTSADAKQTLQEAKLTSEELRADLQTLRAQNDANRQGAALLKQINEERQALEAAQQQSEELVDGGPEGSAPPEEGAPDAGATEPQFEMRRVNGRMRRVQVQ